ERPIGYRDAQAAFDPSETGSASRDAPWCEWRDSNSHGVTHWYLKPARLPIPPHSQARAMCSEEGMDAIAGCRSQASDGGSDGVLRFFPCKRKELVTMAALLAGSGRSTISTAAL